MKKGAHHIEELERWAVNIGCDRCGDEGIGFLNLRLFGIAFCRRCRRVQLYRRLRDKAFTDYWWKRLFPTPTT